MFDFLNYYMHIFCNLNFSVLFSGYFDTYYCNGCNRSVEHCVMHETCKDNPSKRLCKSSKGCKFIPDAKVEKVIQFIIENEVIRVQFGISNHTEAIETAVTYKAYQQVFCTDHCKEYFYGL